MTMRAAALTAVTHMDLSYRTRGDLKLATRQWLEQVAKPTDLYVTFAWNRSKGFGPRKSSGLMVSGAWRDLDEFVKRVDRHSLGRRFHKKPPELRCLLIACPEHMDTNMHYHGILRPGRFREGEDLRDYISECKRIWKALVPGGDLHIDTAGTGVTFAEIRSGAVGANKTAKRVVLYITKALQKPGAWEGLFVAGSIQTR